MKLCELLVGSITGQFISVVSASTVDKFQIAKDEAIGYLNPAYSN